MKILLADDGKDEPIIMMLDKKENDALAAIVAAFLKTKPRKSSNAYKLAMALDNRLLA